MNLWIAAHLNQHHQDMLEAHLRHPNPSKRENQVLMMQKLLVVQLQRKQRWNWLVIYVYFKCVERRNKNFIFLYTSMLKFSRYVSNNPFLYRMRKHQASKRRHHLWQNLHQRPLLHQKVGQAYHLSQRMKSGVFFLQWLQSPHKIWYPDSSLGFEVQRYASLTPFFSSVVVCCLPLCKMRYTPE